LTGDGNVGAGVAPLASTRLFSRGSDATSSNYAVYADNSLGAVTFYARNDGVVYAQSLSVGSAVFLSSTATPQYTVNFTDTTSFSQVGFQQNGSFSAFINNIGSTFATTNRRGALELGTSTSAPVIIYANSVEAYRVFPSTGVAIGSTTDPGASSLSVAGTLSAGVTTASASVASTYNDVLKLVNGNISGGAGSSILFSTSTIPGIRLASALVSATGGNEATSFSLQSYRAGSWRTYLNIDHEGGTTITANTGIGIAPISTARLVSRGADATGSNYAIYADNSLGALTFYARNDGVVYTYSLYVDAGGISAAGSPGVTCSGAPSGSFASVRGVVTAC
jgi:hypothetical protein